MATKLEKFRQFFSQQQFFKKLAEYGKSLGTKTVYSALLLYYAYDRKDTPSWAKKIVVGALGYLIVPMDMAPDLLPGLGYTDDVGVLSFALVTVAAYINKDVRESAQARLSKWIPNAEQADIEAVEKTL